MNPRMQYDPQLTQSYVPQLPVQSQSSWIPHQSNQMPAQVPQYNDKNSHIFIHKETGLQVPDGQEISQMQYRDNMNGQGHDYSKLPNYYGDNNYRQPIQQENWLSADGVYADNQRYAQQNVQVPVQDQTNYKPPSAEASNIKTENVNPKHVQEKLAHDLKNSKNNMDHGNVQNEAKIKIAKHSHHEEYPDVVAYKMSDSNDLQDGYSHTPRGAVLSVTLGLIITFIMAIMIGCRLKMVRRRVRRGKSYAHDADYLVNGMYL